MCACLVQVATRQRTVWRGDGRRQETGDKEGRRAEEEEADADDADDDDGKGGNAQGRPGGADHEQRVEAVFAARGFSGGAPGLAMEIVSAGLGRSGQREGSEGRNGHSQEGTER